ncbi:MAG: SUMF1/EgtB/PvdO family nonheme iron enzyme [Planctomycetes bacterium]|nr:SUMF1/EgtB/PvdO family nonheme iron enzyme [Planctomycetota bacterium]
MPSPGAPGEAEHSLVRLLEGFLKVCDGISFAHARGVIHRDLKPANVMVGEFGEVLVMDWGLAKVFGHSDAAAAHVTPDLAGAQVARKARGSKGDRSEPLEAEPLRTQDGSVMGTPAYMPPEQAAGEIERLSERSDVYSLGAILYQMLTLFPPFTGGSAYAILQRVIEGKFVRPSERAPGRPVPRELEAAVLKAMAKDPAKRYASVAGLRADIEAYLAGRTLAAARYKPWQRAAKWVMRNKAVTAVSAAAAVVLVAASAGFMWKILVEKGRAEENARVAGENAAAEREARQEAERLQRVAEEKARREGDYALLDQYRSAAEGLWPAWPDQVEDMNEWTRGARDLASRLDEHRSRLDTMPAGTSSDLWARDNQTKLVAGLLELREKTIPDVEARTLRGREVGRAAQEHREDWERAIRRIADSPLYGGLVIALQTALVPLGPDPESGLWEFADIQTGLVPERGPDGKLAITEKTGVVLVLLPGGTFWMGAAPRGARNVDPSAQTDEGPVHEVTLEPFFMGKHEMTQGQWERVTGENPSFCKPGVKFGDKTVTLANPVEQVSWEDCDRWLGRLGLVLPTEAQWEYAARAGTQTVWWTGNEKETFAGAGNIIDSNCKRNGGTAGRDYEAWLDDGHTAHAPAGIFRANAFGLADTMGNVWEWCRDVYAADSYQTHPRDRDGLHGEEEAPTASAARSYRGGSWADLADYARSADRFRAASGIRNTDLGVRPARVLASGQ